MQRKGQAAKRGAGEKSRGLLPRIRSVQPGLTSSESAVAGLILDRPHEVIHLTIEELAQRASVSTATVLRFCQNMGLDGFRDFRIALAVELGSSPAVLDEDIQMDDSPMEIARKVFQTDMRAIAQTLQLLEERALNNAVEAIDTAERVEFYGIGSSAPIAVDAYYRFLRIGLPVSVVTDSHMQAVSAAMLTKTGVAFVISHTGRTLETLNTARKAQEAGAKVIALTSFLRAPITKIADIVLVAATAETAFRVEAMASRIAHLSIIDVLYVALATRRPDALATLKRTNAIIEQRRL
jgi:DNA-binding MurR/RpiR family transcriptional regulator